MDLSLLILLGVLVLIAARRVAGLRVEIWQAMTAGAVAVLVSGEISARDAMRAVDLDVMGFLFGMFVIGEALIRSGVLYAVAYRLFSRIRSTDGLVLALLFSAGAASALLMNDTLAIIGTPLALQLAREHRIAPVLLLLTLAFAITIGSVMSPIGNPQNLLIAVRGGMEAPLVALYLPVLDEAGATTAALLALAAGSTVAGNLLIFGAASNIIIIQRAERAAVRLGFRQFARVGIPLALINVLVYLAYLDWYWATSG